MTIHFSTDDVHPRDRLDYWREIATKGFARHTFHPGSTQAYNGAVKLGMLADLRVAEYECDAGVLRRSMNEISSSDNDDALICVMVSGQGAAVQDGRHSFVAGGSFCLLDPRRPFIAEMHNRIKSLVVQVPRQKLEVRLGNVLGLTAHVLDAGKALPALTSGFLAKLPSCLDALDAAGESKLAEQALDLFALAVSGETERKVAALSSSQACTLHRLKSEIELRLSDPRLRPSTVAAAAGISVRYANALLALEDTSLERYIVARRLEQCRRALDDPSQTPRSIGEIAFDSGFSDLSHFGRRFKSAFGSSPSEYRRRLA